MPKRSHVEERPAAQAAKVEPIVLIDRVPEVHDPEFRSLAPAFCELIMPYYRGRALLRLPGYLTIAPDGGCWKLTLSIPTEKLTATVETPTLMDLGQFLENLSKGNKWPWKDTWKARKAASRRIDEALK
jgi:hypothetical protein